MIRLTACFNDIENGPIRLSNALNVISYIPISISYNHGLDTFYFPANATTPLPNQNP